MSDIIQLRKRCLERFFSRANEKQREAIFQIHGAVLIIAGAGSGKTTVLCNRIANILLFGNGYNSDFSPDISEEDESFLTGFANGDIQISPEATKRLSDLLAVGRAPGWKILAVTFTNKAAAELKERLSAMNAGAEEVWASTFHSTCVKILRREIEKLNYKSSFTIYDADDSLRLIKVIMKDLNISDKAVSASSVRTLISHAKDRLEEPEKFPVTSGGKRDFLLERTREIYREYQSRLKAANALDFDDIIMKTVELFQQFPDVLSAWQRRFDYIMVDEYQDTNKAQYRLISLLAAGSQNLCVVGDEDQSIYRFRGASIENILSFEEEFHAKTIKLEQNYRSTSIILDAANGVISNNTQHREKNLWSDLGEGEKVHFDIYFDEQSEALAVANTIMKQREEGKAWNDHVVLYRANAQSRTLEFALSRMGIPYRIIGGTKFYERKEIRDILAYMSVVANPFDTVRLLRIINEPKRGIGDATQAELARISEGLGLSPLEVMERAVEFPTIEKKGKPLSSLAAVFRELSSGIDEDRPLDMLVDDILAATGYEDMLKLQGDEGTVRLENIKELKSGIIKFCEENEAHSLSDYLENIALITDMDSYESGDDKVVLMTMHGAKGLEFDTVFLIGAEENLFPSYHSQQDINDMEEERRLAYVAITRAKRRLFISSARQRLLYGQTMRNKVSRFVGEIPKADLEYNDHTKSAAAAAKKPQRSRPEGYLQAAAERQKRATAAKAATTGGSAQEYAPGERVRHKIFKDGTVLSATKIGGDCLLDIEFDGVGRKKIMANFAKVEKL